MIDQKQHSRENEVALLGAVMRDSSIYEQAREIVTAEQFGWNCYGWVWTAFETLHQNGMRIDTITTGDELERVDKIDQFQLYDDKTHTGRMALSKVRESGNPKNFLS
jgi:replicative DNA helicase